MSASEWAWCARWPAAKVALYDVSLVSRHCDLGSDSGKASGVNTGALQLHRVHAE